MQVLANIDEADVGRMRPGQAVTFRVDAFPTETFNGIVEQVRLQPAVVQNVVTYSTVIAVPNAELKLKPGMTANVNIEVARKTNVLRMPSAALRFRPTEEMFQVLNQEMPPEARGRGGMNAGGAGGGGGRTAAADGATGRAAARLRRKRAHRPRARRPPARLRRLRPVHRLQRPRRRRQHRRRARVPRPQRAVRLARVSLVRLKHAAAAIDRRVDAAVATARAASAAAVADSIRTCRPRNAARRWRSGSRR